MSLRVWLPLNGNLNNQGLDNITITSPNMPTINDNGKIGQCYDFNGTGNALVIDNPIPNQTQNFSFSMWVKFDNSTATMCIYNARTSSGTGIAIFRMNSNQIRFDCGAQITFKEYYPPVNTWIHLCLVKEENVAKLYINGELITENVTGVLQGVYNKGSIGRSSVQDALSINYLKGSLNDYRIYDHALSAKEVKEISKGLILHYQLDGIGAGENLMPNSVDMELGNSDASKGVWRNAGSNTMTRTRVKIDNSPIGQCYGFQNSGQQTYTGDASCYGIDSFPKGKGVTHTASFYARTTVANTTAQAGFSFYNATYVSGTDTKKWASYYMTEINNSWKRCVYTFVSTSTSGNIYIGIGTNGVNTTTQICGFKIEEGSVATPWCPNPADDLYKNLGYNSNIEYDCSGLKNNGTKVGDFTYSTDTPRYNISTVIGLTNAYIETPNILFENIKQGTLNLWINRHSSTSDWRLYTMFANSFNWTGISADFIIIGSTGNIAITLDCCSNTYTHIPDLNKWYMYTIVWDLDTNSAKYYINGILKNTVTNSKINTTYASKHTYHNFGNQISSNTNDYSLSDARIYATCLSDDDIKELYESAAAIDDKGNLYAYSLEEA